MPQCIGTFIGGVECFRQRIWITRDNLGAGGIPKAQLAPTHFQTRGQENDKPGQNWTKDLIQRCFSLSLSANKDVLGRANQIYLSKNDSHTASQTAIDQQ